MTDGKLAKVTILAFKDKKVQSKAGNFPEFVLPINPESYTENLKVEYEKKKGQGNQGTNPKYTATSPKELKLDFVLDGTGTVEGYEASLKELPVPEQITRFLGTVYSVNGTIHQPNRLKINWGEHLVFDCVLSGVDINYTLFKPDGTPIRAKLSATFLNYIEEEKRVKEQDNNSPYLTHVFPLRGGETLAYKAYEIYGATNYYLQVARANELTSFRNVQEGRELVFPPIEKNPAGDSA